MRLPSLSRRSSWSSPALSPMPEPRPETGAGDRRGRDLLGAGLAAGGHPVHGPRDPLSRFTTRAPSRSSPSRPPRPSAGWGKRRDWGSAWEQVTPAKQAPRSRDGRARGAPARTGTTPRAAPQIPCSPTRCSRTRTVEVFLRVGSSGWVKMAESPVERRVGSKNGRAPRRALKWRPRLPGRHAASRFLHLSGPRRGQTRRSDACPRSSAPRQATTSWFRRPLRAMLSSSSATARSSCRTRARGAGPSWTASRSRRPCCATATYVELGSAGPRLRLRDGNAPPVPLGQALAWARPEGAPDRFSDVPGLARALLRETSVRTTLPFRITLAGVALAGRAHLRVDAVAGPPAAARGGAPARGPAAGRGGARALRAARSRRSGSKAEADRSALAARMEELRAREEQLNRQLAEAASGEVHAVREDLVRTRDRLASLETERAVGERIIREYGHGVCLVQGAYAFYDGERASAALPSRRERRGPCAKSDGSPRARPARNGLRPPRRVLRHRLPRRPAEGLILTNRHVAEPWWNDDAADALRARGFRPRFALFRAFFPREGGAFRARDGPRSPRRATSPSCALDLRGRQASRCSPSTGPVAARCPASRWSWWATPPASRPSWPRRTARW